MTRWRRTVVLMAALLCGACMPRTRVVDGGRYGQVKVIVPPYRVRGLVILFSDRNGLGAADDAMAKKIAESGAMVAEVDTPAYLSQLDQLAETCHQPAFDVEWFSRQIQRGSRNYFTPILAGKGEGATLAATSLSYAPAATIAGVISLDPSATIASRIPICSTGKTEKLADGFRYEAWKEQPGFWSVGLTCNESIRNRDYVTDLGREGASFQVHEVGPHESTSQALRVLIEPHLTSPRTQVTDVSTLPLVVLGVEHPSNLMAIVISGDGGWRDIDKSIAENLQHEGVPVVGWDSLRYFWSKKTARETADDLALVMRTFMHKWHADRVALIGYSFGADVMPFAYNRLPADLREHVNLIALLGFSKGADFEITVTGWLGEPPGPAAIPVQPETNKIPAALMQCFYGQDESDSACPDLARRGIEVIRISGGHHFDGNYAALARDIMARLKSPSLQARQSSGQSK